ncbi:MAG TPA: hypothetical protein VGG37_06580 [Opitutaceae bacterium]|jgi:hypothetical protein
MKLLTLPLLAAAALGLPGALGAPMVRDLGMGLTYYRIRQLPQDQPTPPLGRPGACILDLRYAASDEAAAVALKAWVAFNVSSHAPIFILENAQTDPALLAALPGRGPPGLVVLAPESARIGPQIAVKVSAESDRKAYEALEKGADIQSLLRDFPDKPRVDEAYLEKEHLADTDAPDVGSDKTLPPPPLVDRLLQRAYQLHRGLLALNRIRP